MGIPGYTVGGAATYNDDLFTPQKPNPVGLDGRKSNAGHWGGYIGGAEEAADRYQGMAATAASRKAATPNYEGTASGHRMQELSRGYQSDAMSRAAMAAQGNGLQSQGIGRWMLEQGAASQRAAAASVRGGALSQAVALQQQRAGEGAYMQEGQRQLAAQRANEMATARHQYANAATGMRDQDLALQAQMEDRARQRQRAELAQRNLNDQAQIGYDTMADDVNKSQQTANIHEAAVQTREAQARAQDAANQDAADWRAVGNAAQTAGSILSMASDSRTKMRASPVGVSRQLADGLAPYRYEYKPGFDSREGQRPGESNIGPMAQNMARNPVTATAVERGDDGLLYLNNKKATKLALGGIGELAAKQQQLEADMAALKKRK